MPNVRCLDPTRFALRVEGKRAKPTKMSNNDWEKCDLHACSNIWLNLAMYVMYYVMHEKSASSIRKIGRQLHDKYYRKLFISHEEVVLFRVY